MGQTTLVQPKSFDDRRYSYGFEDDFLWYISPHLWTSTVTDSGTVAVSDGAAGIAVLSPSDGTVGDNDEAYLATTKELFKFADNKPFVGEARIQYAEAATNAANIGMFFQSAVGANSIIDDGGGLKVSGDTVGIYKVDGGTVWKCVSVINGGTAVVSTSTATAGGTAYQRLRIECKTVGSVAEITFWIDNGNGITQLMETVQNGRLSPIKHTWTIASATEMAFGIGVKNGSTTMETLNVDYAQAYQAR